MLGQHVCSNDAKKPGAAHPVPSGDPGLQAVPWAVSISMIPLAASCCLTASAAAKSFAALAAVLTAMCASTCIKSNHRRNTITMTSGMNLVNWQATAY
jgi:hypothetical protein